MRFTSAAALSLATLATLGFFLGCGHQALEPAASAMQMTGKVQGGQQSISGATIQLYAVSSSGDGTASTPLLTKLVTTDQDGNFTITLAYTCPVANPQVYIVATGGNPGLAAPTNNAAIAVMAALGPCMSLTPSTFTFLNEVTTVGSLAALYPYMSSYAALGYGNSDAASFLTSASLVNEYTNTTIGGAPGPTLPANFYASSNEINTLSNIIAACINSDGSLTNGTACGTLFQLVKPVASPAPTDTIGAVLDILKNPTANITSIFNLAAATGAPFQPTLTSTPSDWTLPIVAIPGTPTFSLAQGSYLGTQTIQLNEPTSGATVYYTLDGTAPTTSSSVYSGSISLTASATIRAFAILAGRAVSGIASSSYIILPPPASISVVTGSGQSAEINAALPTPLQVLVSDTSSHPVSGAVVAFTSPSTGAGAALSQPTCTTAANGMCSITAIANSASGTYTVTASTAALSAYFTLTNTGAHSYLVTVSTDTTSGVASNCIDQSSASNPSNAHCSLRDALTAAASNATSTLSVTITFAQTTSTQITLANGTLTIPSYTTIQGATSGSGPTLANLITVDGNYSAIVFTQNSGVIQSAINNLTIAHGYNSSLGAGIYMSGSLTIANSTFTSNVAATSGGAISNSGGTLTILDSTFLNNQATGYYGGAIDNFASGILIITNSTFSGNQAGEYGGAVYTHGTATITSSTFSGNTAPFGAGMYNLGALAVTNSLLTDTGEECGGLYCAPTWVYVAFSALTPTPVDSAPITVAFSDNLGRTFSQTVTYGTFSTPTSIASTLGPYFYENYSGLDTASITGQGIGNLLVVTPTTGTTLGPITITNPGHSFTATQAFYTNPLLLSGSNNIVGLTPTQAKLSALGNYGGPTQTFVPLTGSAALCAISPSSTSGTDQRGQPRTVIVGATTCQDAGSVQTSQ